MARLGDAVQQRDWLAMLALLVVYGNEWTVDAVDAEFDIAYYAGNGFDAVHYNLQVQQRCNHEC